MGGALLYICCREIQEFRGRQFNVSTMIRGGGGIYTVSCFVWLRGINFHGVTIPFFPFWGFREAEQPNVNCKFALVFSLILKSFYSADYIMTSMYPLCQCFF